MVLQCVLRVAQGRTWPDDRKVVATTPAEARLSPCKGGKALWFTAGDQNFGVLINGRATRLLLCGNTIHVRIGRVVYELQLRQGNSSTSLVVQKRGVVPSPRAVPLPDLEAA